MNEIVLARYGQLNRSGTALSEFGEGQAARLAEKIRERKIVEVYTSLAPWAMRYGEIIAKALDAGLWLSWALGDFGGFSSGNLGREKIMVQSLVHRIADNSVVLVVHPTRPLMLASCIHSLAAYPINAGPLDHGDAVIIGRLTGEIKFLRAEK